MGNKILTIIIAGLCVFPALAQDKIPNDSLIIIADIEEGDTNVKYFFDEAYYKDSLAGYEALFGKFKKVPDTLKLPFFVALSRYPELYKSKIEVEGRAMFTTMAARPSNASIFKNKTNRHYKIYINNRKGSYKGIHLAKLNFNMRVGFFGHELAHLLSYQMRNGAQLVGMGFKYVFSKKYKRKTERQTDMETIKRGMGFPLYETKKFILYSKKADIPRAYRMHSKKNYMTDDEVLDAIRHISFQNTATYSELKKY